LDFNSLENFFLETSDEKFRYKRENGEIQGQISKEVVLKYIE
jgi:hypothetical protein